MKAEILLASGMHKLHWCVAPLPSLLVLLMGKKEIKKGKKIVIQSWYFFPQKLQSEFKFVYACFLVYLKDKEYCRNETLIRCQNVSKRFTKSLLYELFTQTKKFSTKLLYRIYRMINIKHNITTVILTGPPCHLKQISQLPWFYVIVAFL